MGERSPNGRVVSQAIDMKHVTEILFGLGSGCVGAAGVGRLLGELKIAGNCRELFSWMALSTESANVSLPASMGAHPSQRSATSNDQPPQILQSRNSLSCAFQMSIIKASEKSPGKVLIRRSTENAIKFVKTFVNTLGGKSLASVAGSNRVEQAVDLSRERALLRAELTPGISSS